MDKAKLAILFSAVLIVGCGAFSELGRMGKFDRTAKAYSKIMSWSDFESAYYFGKEAKTDQNPPDFEKLERIKVTSYELKRVLASEDQSQVRQIVEIHYYSKDDMIERTLRDIQLWEYDEKTRNWRLVSGLPDFK